MASDHPQTKARDLFDYDKRTKLLMRLRKSRVEAAGNAHSPAQAAVAEGVDGAEAMTSGAGEAEALNSKAVGLLERRIAELEAENAQLVAASPHVDAANGGKAESAKTVKAEAAIKQEDSSGNAAAAVFLPLPLPVLPLPSVSSQLSPRSPTKVLPPLQIERRRDDFLSATPAAASSAASQLSQREPQLSPTA